MHTSATQRLRFFLNVDAPPAPPSSGQYVATFGVAQVIRTALRQNEQVLAVPEGQGYRVTVAPRDAAPIADVRLLPQKSEHFRGYESSMVSHLSARRANIFAVARDDMVLVCGGDIRLF